MLFLAFCLGLSQWFHVSGRSPRAFGFKLSWDTHTAKTLWSIYLGLTVVRTILLMLAGQQHSIPLHIPLVLWPQSFSTKLLSVGCLTIRQQKYYFNFMASLVLILAYIITYSEGSGIRYLLMKN